MLLQVSLLLFREMGWLHKIMCPCTSARVVGGDISAKIGEWPITVSSSRKSSWRHGLCSQGPAQWEDRACSRSVESLKV